MQCDHGAGRGGLPKSDVGDDAAAAEDADAVLPAAGEGRDAVDDVRAGADLQNVASEGVRAFLGDDDGRFGLVLGAGRAAARAATAAAALDHLVAGGLVVGVAAVVVVLVATFVVVVAVGILSEGRIGGVPELEGRWRGIHSHVLRPPPVCHLNSKNRKK